MECRIEQLLQAVSLIRQGSCSISCDVFHNGHEIVVKVSFCANYPDKKQHFRGDNLELLLLEAIGYITHEMLGYAAGD